MTVTTTGVIVYLVLGYFWTLWFVHHVLDDQTWADGHERVGMFSLLFINIIWGFMAFILFFSVGLPWLVKRMYGVTEKPPEVRWDHVSQKWVDV